MEALMKKLAEENENLAIEILSFIVEEATREEKNIICEFVSKLLENNKDHHNVITGGWFYIDPAQSNRRSAGFTYHCFADLMVGIICWMSSGMKKDNRKTRFPDGLRQKIVASLNYDGNVNPITIDAVKIKPTILAKNIKKYGDCHIWD